MASANWGAEIGVAVEDIVVGTNESYWATAYHVLCDMTSMVRTYRFFAYQFVFGNLTDFRL